MANDTISATIQLLSGETLPITYSTLDELRAVVVEHLGVSLSRIRLFHPDGWDILDPPLLLSLFEPAVMETPLMYAVILDPPIAQIILTRIETAYDEGDRDTHYDVWSIRISWENEHLLMYFYAGDDGRIFHESSVEVGIPSMLTRHLNRKWGDHTSIHTFTIDPDANVYYNPSEFLQAEWFPRGEEIVSLVRRFWRGEVELPYEESDIFRFIDTDEYHPEIEHMVQSVSTYDHRYHHNAGKYTMM